MNEKSIAFNHNPLMFDVLRTFTDERKKKQTNPVSFHGIGKGFFKNTFCIADIVKDKTFMSNFGYFF